eukprot:m.127811 g.127811  ORF g.127811 m.127811 type:complete len:107 (+) comp37936_c0_seq3:1431-1751(+)
MLAREDNRRWNFFMEENSGRYSSTKRVLAATLSHSSDESTPSLRRRVKSVEVHLDLLGDGIGKRTIRWATYTARAARRDQDGNRGLKLSTRRSSYFRVRLRPSDDG